MGLRGFTIVEEIDKFFAEVKNKYQQKEKPSSIPVNPQSSTFSAMNNSNINGDSQDNVENTLANVMSDFQDKKLNKNQEKKDDLFQEIANKFNKNKSKDKNNYNQKEDDLFQEIQNKFEQVKTKTQHKDVEDIFSDVQAQFSAQKQVTKTKLDEADLTEIENKYQQKKSKKLVNNTLTIEEIKQEELNKQRRQKALLKQAQQWLKKLDPYSDESLWFEEFAYSYESKLEAAIDYLDALNKNKF